MADASHSDRARLVRFWTSARGFWRGKSAMIAWPLTVSLVVIAVLQLAVQYRLNYWNRDFFNALARHDGDTLWRQVALFAPLAIMSVGLSVISVWARMTTQRKWRQWLTTNILGDWFAEDHYRKLEADPGEYKNAEYRISYDVKTATDSPVDLTLGLVNSVMTAGRLHRRTLVDRRRADGCRWRPDGDHSGVSRHRRGRLCSLIHRPHATDRP